MEGASNVLAIGMAVLAGTAVFIAHGLTFEAVELGAFVAVLVLAAFIDARTRRIPNGLVLAACAIRLIYIVVACMAGTADALPLLVNSLVGMAVIGGGLLLVTLVLDKVTGKANLGGGDIKLFGAVGLCLGLRQGAIVLAVACLIGAAFGAITQGAGKQDGPQAGVFAFGPAIAIATIATVLASSPLVGFLF